MEERYWKHVPCFNRKMSHKAKATSISSSRRRRLLLARSHGVRNSLARLVYKQISCRVARRPETLYTLTTIRSLSSSRPWTHAIYHVGNKREKPNILRHGLIAGGVGVRQGRLATYFSAVNPSQEHISPTEDSLEPQKVPTTTISFGTTPCTHSACPELDNSVCNFTRHEGGA